MTKYCAKCGKALPEGVEICPDCGPDAREGEAALFTRMTAETEVWKTAEPAKQRKAKIKIRKPHIGGHTLAMGGCAAVVVIAAVLLILLSQPAGRVTRAIRRGDYEKAYTIFWKSRSLASGERNEKVDSALMDAARDLCTRYAEHEIDADSAASQLSLLGGFGEGAAAMLEETYAEFRSFNGSQERMLAADAFFDAGEFLEARKEYLNVLDTDADYAAAQERAAECLVRYGEQVGAEADALMEKDDYPGALAVLDQGNDTLYRYDTFSEVIDDKVLECRDRYETFVLGEAEALAEKADYDGALAYIEARVPDFPSQPDSFTAALGQYAELATEKHVADAGARADELYAAGEYAAAFAELDDVRAAAAENEPGADALIAALEQRFAEETCAAAEETYAGERKNLPDAIAILDDALEARELESVRAYREDLAQYLPLKLVEAEFFAKTGTVFRSDTEFESLDGTKFGGGWIWGEDGAEISFALDGAYDEFYCAFAVRRDDNANANGRFEVWCDGRQVLKSDKLFHWQTDPMYFQVDVSGCQELKLVFISDYKVSTAEDGYCYHGLCDAQITKNLPQN